MKSFGLSETKSFHFYVIFKINEINLQSELPHISGTLDLPLHLGVYLENSLIWMI